MFRLLFTCIIFSAICSCDNTRKQTPFNQKDIIANLEAGEQETYHFFIDLEHPYFYSAGSRLTLYADKTRWAIVFEKSGYDNRGYACEIEFAYFGNCLINLQSLADRIGVTSNMKSELLITPEDLQKIEADDNDVVSKKAREVRVRDTILAIVQDRQVYEKNGIRIRSDNNPDSLIDIPSFIRYLQEQNPALFFARNRELRMCIPADLPMLMHIDSWHHESYSRSKRMTSPTDFEYQVDGTKPGDYETYKMIADILVTKDTSLWKPTLKPNNNWRNWPDGGNL